MNKELDPLERLISAARAISNMHEMMYQPSLYQLQELSDAVVAYDKANESNR